MAERGASLQDLVGDVVRDGASLVRIELSLFKAEMSSNVTGIAKGAAMVLASSVFAVASLIWLTQALVYGLEILTQSKWISALIVGGLLAAIAGLLVMIGSRYISAASLTPKRTMQSVRRAADILSEKPVP